MTSPDNFKTLQSSEQSETEVAEQKYTSRLNDFLDLIYEGKFRPYPELALMQRNQESEALDLPEHEAEYKQEIEYLDLQDSLSGNPDQFLRGLIAYVEAKAAEKTPASEKALTVFLEEIQEAYFRFNAIISECSLSFLIELGAKANRVPEIQGWFGQSMVGEITYTLSSIDSTSLREIEQGIAKLPLPERLDVINFLQTIAADAVANGDWAEPALYSIDAMLQQMHTNSQSPFLDYAIELSRKAIESEEENPSLSVVTFNGNSNNGRLQERLEPSLVEESTRLAHQIRSSIPLSLGDKYLRISQDAVAIISRTNTPKYYGKIKREELKEESPVDTRAIERIKKGADNPEALSKLNLPNVLDYVNSNLLDDDSFEEQGRWWGEQVGVLSVAEWTQLFSFRQKIAEAKHQLQLFERDTERDIADKYEKASIEWATKVYATVKSMVEQGEAPPKGWLELQNGSVDERAFRRVDAIFLRLSKAQSLGLPMPGGFYARPEMRELAAEWEELNELHQRSLQEAGVKVQERYASAEQERYTYILEYNRLLDRLVAQAPELQKGLLKLATKMEDELLAELPRVGFLPYKDLLSDKTLNPFPDPQAAELPLLLEQLHRPLMRAQIERDLGIAFEDFNLNSQVHLLQFLAGRNKETFKGIQSVLQKNPAYKKEFLISFLSCAGDYAFGDTLVELTQRYSPEIAEQIFRKYAELVQASEQAREYLQDNFGSQLENKPGLEEAIGQSLLKKGKDLLVRAADSKLSEANLQGQLQNYTADTQLFHSTLQEARSSGETVDLESFKDVYLESVEGTNLSVQLRKELLDISTANWQGQGREGMEVIKNMRELLNPEESKEPEEKRTQLQNSRFYLMRHKDEVLAFFRLTTQTDGSYYFGSVNANPNVPKAGIGESLLEKVFSVEAQGKRVVAECSPTAAITTKYIGKFGFVVNGVSSFVKDGDTFDIVRDTRPGIPVNTEQYRFASIQSVSELEKLQPAYQDDQQRRIVAYELPRDQLTFNHEMTELFKLPNAVITACQQKKDRQSGAVTIFLGVEGLNQEAITSPSTAPESVLAAREH